MLEYLSGPFIYSLLKDAVGWMTTLLRRTPPQDIIKLRQKWKPEFEANLRKRQRAELRSDVIIRDVKRFDSYPDINEKERGISPWFRVGFLDTYHKGILVGLGWEKIKETPRGWRTVDYAKGESDGTAVMLIGYIPYEKIESVDWEGDEYYGYPHIYCHFSAKQKQPYERVAFCTENQNPGGNKFYTELADYSAVRKLNKSLGIGM